MQERYTTSSIKDFVPKPWALSVEDTLIALDSDPQQGLTTQEAARRTRQYGPNTLREVKPRSSWEIFINQFKNLIVYFLVAAALLSFVLGDHVEGLAIVAVILINAAIGFITELKGVRSIEALRKLGIVNSRVRRNGAVSEIPAQDLVPGDIIILEGGDIITADLRILSASKLQADESPLTGESLPVAKSTDILPNEVPLAERANMLFKGTAVTRGSGEALVTGSGMATELGSISSLVHETVVETTQLEKRLNQLGHWLIWVSLGIAALVGVTGIAAGRDIFLMIETGIAMGLRGTQVAREASDIILKDDSFASIVHAVKQGRIIFKNIKSFVVYLLSCNFSEIMTVGLAAFANAPLPLLPLQILFLNLVTDVFPALALAASEASPDIMKEEPRKKGDPIMNTERWFIVGIYGFVITVAVLGAMAIALFYFDMDEKTAVTISFLTLAFAQLWHVFNMRDKSSGFFNNAIVRNPFVWGALLLCTLLLAATVYVPLLAEVLNVANPGVNGWLLVFIMSLVPMFVGQIALTVLKRRVKD